MSDIRVLIVDDQPVVRWGLGTAISEDPGMEVIGDGNGAAKQLKRHLNFCPT